MVSLHETLSFIQDDIAPYVLQVIFVSAALLNPKIEEINIFQAAVPYIFIISLISWGTFTSIWIVHLVIQRRWHRLISDTVLEWIRWVWTELKQLHRFYLVKTAVGTVLSVSLLLSAQWMYFHFDIWRLVSTICTFFVDVWHALFKVHMLVVLVHEWTNSAGIRALHAALEFAQTLVRDYPVPGLLLITTLLASVACTVALVRCCRENCQP